MFIDNNSIAKVKGEGAQATKIIIHLLINVGIIAKYWEVEICPLTVLPLDISYARSAT
uniref:Uncharacterized protein n=1 Tax=Anguilla anguilla TaxID=7936 RepID=A0A0E9U738_ANGAN